MVRPEWQGLGIGPRVSDINARDWVLKGVRFLSRTAHPRFGAYRNSSPLWQATTANETANLGDTFSSMKEKKGKEVKKIEKARPSFSHEYIGDDECKAAAKEAKAERLAAAAATPAAHRGAGRRRRRPRRRRRRRRWAPPNLDLLRGRRQLDRPPLRTPPPAAPRRRRRLGGAERSPLEAGARASGSAGAGGRRSGGRGEAEHVHKPGVRQAEEGHVCTAAGTAAPAAPVTATLAAANQLRRDASDASSSTEAPPTTDEGATTRRTTGCCATRGPWWALRRY